MDGLEAEGRGLSIKTLLCFDVPESCFWFYSFIEYKEVTEASVCVFCNGQSGSNSSVRSDKCVCRW